MGAGDQGEIRTRKERVRELKQGGRSLGYAEDLHRSIGRLTTYPMVAETSSFPPPPKSGEREKEREQEGKRESEREGERGRKRGKETERKKERKTGRKTERKTERKTGRKTERKTERKEERKIELRNEGIRILRRNSCWLCHVERLRKQVRSSYIARPQGWRLSSVLGKRIRTLVPAKVQYFQVGSLLVGRSGGNPVSVLICYSLGALQRSL